MIAPGRPARIGVRWPARRARASMRDMPRAASVREAAFRQLATYDRNVWEDRKGVLPDFDDVYVERPAPVAHARSTIRAARS